MDAIDQQLLALLRENARAPTAELARRLSLSRTTVQSRIERLERGGVILGYSVRTGAVHSTAQVRALVMIVAAPRLSQAIESALRRAASGAHPPFGQRRPRFHRRGGSRRHG